MNGILNMFKKNEKQPDKPTFQQQPTPPQQYQQQVEQEKPKPRVLQGLKIKAKQQQQQEVVEEPEQKQQTSSEILQQQQSDAYKQQMIHSQMECPSEQQYLPQETFQTPTPEPEEVKQSIESVRKKPTGFGFLKKKQQEESQDIQQRSEIILSLEPKNQQSPDQSSEPELNYVPQQPLMVQEQAKLEEQQKTEEVVVEEPPKPKSFLTTFKRNKEEKKGQSQESDHRSLYNKLMKELDEFEWHVGLKLSDIYIRQQECEQKRDQLYFPQIQHYGGMIQQLSNEQQLCVEKEMFEKAEELEQQLKQLKDKVEYAEEEIKNINKVLLTLQDEKENLRGDEYPFYQSMGQKLEEVERQFRRYADEYKVEGHNQIRRLQTQIEEENEKVKISQIHQEIDQKHIDEEEDSLGKSMTGQTKEYCEQKEKLQDIKNVLVKEIDELMKILKAKQNELRIVNENLDGVTEKIEQVQEKFNHKLVKLQNKRYLFKLSIQLRQTLQDQMLNLTRERAFIETLESECERKQVEVRNRIDALANQINQILERRDLLHQKAENIPIQCQKEIDALYQYRESSARAHAAYQDYQLIEKQMDEVQYKKTMGQQQLNEMLEGNQELQVKIQKMGDDKATLLQNKNFKGAQAINNQIKDAQTQIQQNEQKIQENYASETLMIQQIEQLNKQKEMKQQVYEELKRTSDIHRYFVLQLRLEEIRWISNGTQELNQIKEEVSQLVIIMELYSKYGKELDQQIQASGMDEEQEDNMEQQQQSQEVAVIMQEEQQQVVVQGEIEVEEVEKKEQEPVQEQEEQQEEVQIEKKMDIEAIKEGIEKAKQLQMEIEQMEHKMNEHAEKEEYDEAEEIKIQQDKKIVELEEIKSIFNKNYQFSDLTEAQNYLDNYDQ